MYDKPIIRSGKYGKILVTVEYVFRANFNDSFWLFEKEIEIDKQTLVWFDPYFGRNNKNDVKIALAECTDDGFVFLEKRGEIIRECRTDFLLGHTVCDDFDEAKLIVAHVRLK